MSAQCELPSSAVFMPPAFTSNSSEDYLQIETHRGAPAGSFLFTLAPLTAALK